MAFPLATEHYDKFRKNIWPNPVTGCWNWQRALNARGYGIMCGYRKEIELAHRFSFRVHGGTLDNGPHVLHRCDNPSCCNPNHLYSGTDAKNVADMIERGRSRRGHLWGRDVASPATKLTPGNVVEIRVLAAGGMAHREIAKRFGVARSTISRAVNHSNHRSVKCQSQ